MKNVKMRFLLPLFFGCLGSLFFCILFAARQPDIFSPRETRVTEVSPEKAHENFFEPETTHIFARADSDRYDIIQESYRRTETREFVIEFFAEICPSREIAEVILVYSDMFDIAPALALALAWEESRLNPRAVNSRNRDGSIDRGLFQLNNRSFPRLELQSFFNPGVNAKFGMSHLRYCLDAGVTEIAALAMYNAGTGRVTSSGTPKSTLDYISRILENRMKIEKRFIERDSLFFDDADFEKDFSGTVADAKSDRPRLMPLKPLAGG
jgi:hypothetical protein